MVKDPDKLFLPTKIVRIKDSLRIGTGVKELQKQFDLTKSELRSVITYWGHMSPVPRPVYFGHKNTPYFEDEDDTEFKIKIKDLSGWEKKEYNKRLRNERASTNKRETNPLPHSN